jgi:molybdenum cofactor cytidylyltransferase
MGRPKHLLPIDGVPMLERVVCALRDAALDPVIVVLRPGDEAGRSLGEALGVQLTWMEDPEEGRAASVRAGVRAVPGSSEAILFALADQPYLEPDDFARLLAAFASGEGRLVHASYAGQRGSPVLFASAFRDELLELRGREGGRVLLARHPESVVPVALDPAHGRDLDRPEDLPES